MRILVAPQEFKGTLTAVEAATAIEAGLRRGLPDADVDLLPVADGGPGTVAAVVAAAGGRLVESPASDPLGRPLTAAWGILPDGTAVIEMAAASGLTLLRESELDPRIASTFGTGMLIRAALDAGCRQIIVGVGGSATNDAGAGCAAALGARFLDVGGNELAPGGAALARLARIEVAALDPRLREAQVLVASDVTNPLAGPQGASAVYGPQKGADPAAVAELDAALAHMAEVVRRDLGIDMVSAPGAGAAGGLGYGLMVFCGAKVVPGFDLVAAHSRFDERVAVADLVITGEGRLDAQTAFGKAPGGVARRARAAGKRVVAIVGSVEGDEATGLFDMIIPLSRSSTVARDDSDDAADQLSAAAESLAREIANRGEDAAFRGIGTPHVDRGSRRQ